MGQKKCGKGHTHQNTIALKAVLRDQGGFLLLCVGIRISENRINKPAVLVDKTAQSDIINTKTTGTAVNDVYSIGKIDVEKYQNITDKRILTNEVIITDNRIEHIIQRRGQNFYVEYHEYFSSIIEDPDYIFKDIKADTAIVSKVFSHKGKNINLVVRLVVEGDDPNFKNSIITAISESEKRFAQRLRNNTPVYKKLDSQE